MNSTDIAALMGLTIVRFSVLKSSTLYKQVHNAYMTGVLQDMDSLVKDSYTGTQKSLSFVVPMAMQTLVQQAMHAKDERIRNKACNDLLDRDGRFAKVTRIGLPTGDQGGVAEDKDNRAVADMVKALSTVPNNTGAKIEDEPITDQVQ